MVFIDNGEGNHMSYGADRALDDIKRPDTKEIKCPYCESTDIGSYEGSEVKVCKCCGEQFAEDR